MLGSRSKVGGHGLLLWVRVVPFKGTPLGGDDLDTGHTLCNTVSIRDRIITSTTSASGSGKVKPHVRGLVILHNTSPVAVSQPELQLCHSRPLIRC